MENFGIVLEEGEYIISDYGREQNEKFLKLYDWQKKAIDFFWKNKNVVYEVITGAGKTYLTIQLIKQILEKQPNAYFLIVVPKNIILEKTWLKELYNNGFGMNRVGVFYGFAKEIKQITITNMQSIGKLDLKLFEILIADEIHNYCTKKLFDILEHEFTHKIGLSATIQRTDKQHWRMIRSFNYNVFKYDAKEALYDNVLNRFDFFNIAVEMDSVDYDIYEKLTQEIGLIVRKGGSFHLIMSGKMGEEMRLQLLQKLNERKNLVLNYYLKMEVLKLVCVKHKTNKILVFNEYNKTTTSCYFNLLDVNIRAKIIHSGIDKVERDKTINDYSNDKFNVLLTTKVLDEGYNLPKIDVAIIMANSSTARQTIQRMGRVLRKKQNKSLLYQIYVKNTMEEVQAIERAKMFKELCSEYKEYIYVKNELQEV